MGNFIEKRKEYEEELLKVAITLYPSDDDKSKQIKLLQIERLAEKIRQEQYNIVVGKRVYGN